jgi:PAS domain S-box-containing protein
MAMSNRRLVSFFLFTAFSLLIVGIAFYVYQEEIRNHRQNIAIEQTHHLENQTALIQESFRHCAYALLFLTNQIRLHQSFKSTAGREALANDFISFLDSSELYDQIRLLDIHGMEVIRARYHAGEPKIIPKHELQQSGGQDYFVKTIRLNANEIYISPMVFTSQHGKGGLSMEPVIQLGMPVFDRHGQKTGMIEMNYLAEIMLSQFKKVAGFEGLDVGESMLLNDDGYWLAGPGLQRKWGFMFADRSQNYLEIISPEAWEHISSQKSGHFVMDGDQYHFATLNPAEMVASISGINSYRDPQPAFWKVISRYPQTVFSLTTRETRNSIILFTLSFLLLINCMFWFLARAIARRRQTEAELRLSERNYRMHIESVSDVVYFIDPGFRIVDISPSVEAMLGYKPEELVGRSLKELGLMTRESARQTVADMKSIIKGKAIKSRDLTFVAKDGTHCIGEGSGAPYYTDGKISGFVGVIRDITQRKQMEEKLRESEDRLKKIITAANDAIFIVDTKKYNIIEVNQKAVSMFGYSIEEFDLLRMSNMSSEGTDGQLGFYLNETASSGQGATCELTLRKKDGMEIPTELSTAPIHLGGRTLILVMVRDITDRKRAEALEKLQIQERERASRLMILGRMSAEIAHELHQPLSAILSYADTCLRLMKTGEMEADKMTRLLGKISGQADRAGHVVRHVGNFTRSQEVQRASLDLNMLIIETLNVSELEARKYRIKISTELTKLLPPVFADHLLIQQVLLNLIRNACEAMETMEPGKRQLIIQTDRGDNDCIKVSVCDQGPGLQPDELEHMFDPFFSLKKAGMGLGLSVSYSIIENHGGRLWAEMLPETGLVVCFTLPIVGELCHED